MDDRPVIYICMYNIYSHLHLCSRFSSFISVLFFACVVTNPEYVYHYYTHIIPYTYRKILQKNLKKQFFLVANVSPWWVTTNKINRFSQIL